MEDCGSVGVCTQKGARDPGLSIFLFILVCNVGSLL